MDFNKLKEMGLEYANKGKAVALDLTEKGKIEVKSANAQMKMAKIQRQLGALVYSLAKNGEENQALVDQYVAELAAIEAEIEQLHAKAPEVVDAAMEKVKAAVEGLTAEEKAVETEDEPVAAGPKTCPQCGAEVADEALFCNKCGAKL